MKLLLLVAGCLLAAANDATATFQQLCQENGFKSEQHSVTTQDGYILTLFRIPGLLNETSNIPPKQPLLMHHGLIDSSDTWVVNTPSLAPGFVMAAKGYDVWLGNSRGNKYSTAHTTLSTSSKAFWAFTWQDFAQYDIPADINYILNITTFPKLTYMGHSQGTLIMFALLSSQPQWADKITTFVAVGPVGTVRNLTSSLVRYVADTSVFDLLEDAGIYDFLPNPDMPELYYLFCKVLADVCDDGIQIVADLEVQGVDNLPRFPTIMAHEPGGTSILNMQHWSQMTQYPAYYMQDYDYGTTENMQVYGQPNPPKYDLSQIRAPVATYFGIYDKLADPIDGQWLRAQLTANTNLPGLHIVDDLLFGHLSFMWGLDVSYLDDVDTWVQQWTAGNSPASRRRVHLK